MTNPIEASAFYGDPVKKTTEEIDYLKENMTTKDLVDENLTNLHIINHMLRGVIENYMIIADRLKKKDDAC